MADSVKIRITGDDSGFRKTLSGLGTVAKTSLVGLTAAVGVVSTALTAAGTAGVRYNATIEQLQTSFEVMTGSAEKAADVVRELRDLGASTPYDFLGLAQTTQTLMQYSFTADQAIDATKMIGDIAQGSADKMGRIAAAYGQMSSAGKVSLEDIKQMIEAGFNPLLVISEQTGESMDSLYTRISEGTITVDEITNAMIAATSEGGMFFQSMEKQSETLNGQLSTLKDNLESFGGTVFAGLSEELRTTILPTANAIVEEFNRAYEVGGIDGLMRSIEKKIPKLITAATNLARNVLAGVGKRIPSLVNQLFVNLPQTLESGFAILENLVDVLFDTVEVIVTNLVERFPEYAPIILKGIGNLAMSILTGAADVIMAVWRGIFGGSAEYELERAVDRMFENVDQDRVKEMADQIAEGVDASTASEAIAAALADIQAAFDAYNIDEEKIAGLIGQDYETVYAALISFGMPPGTAETVAGRVTEINNVISAQLEALNISMPADTLIKLFSEADGNRAIIINALRSMGLSATQIQGIIALYNGYAGDLGTGIVSLVDTIATALTDGEADTETIVQGLIDQANAYYDGVHAQIDVWEEAEIAELDPNAENYAEAVDNIRQKADEMRTAIEESQAATVAFITECAGKSTEEVLARMAELDAIEERTKQVVDQMDAAVEQSRQLGQDQYKVVTAGATTDEATIATAVSFAFESYKVEQQEIQQRYDEAMAQLQADFASGKIGSDEYVEAEAALRLTYDTDMSANQANYENALLSIFRGVADAMPDDISAPLIEAADNLDVASQIEEVLNAAMTDENFDFSTVGDEVRAAYDAAFGEGAFNMALTNGNTTLLVDGLQKTADGLILAAADTLENADTGVLGVTMAAVIEEGFADGTSLVDMDEQSMIGAVFYNLIDHGAAIIEAGEPEITAAAEEAVSGVPDAADVSDETFEAGVQTVNGYAYGIASREDFLNRTIDRVIGSVPSRFRNLLEVKSPSRVTMRIGEYTGEGFEIGIVRSLKHAVAAAEGLVGSMNLQTKLTAPALTGAFNSAAQDIADAEAGRPLVLMIDGKEVGQVTAPYSRTAQNSYNHSIALGVGKG